MNVITLTTDFGLHDHYVAAMKGVVLGIAPTVRLVDVTHDIEPQNVMHAAHVLRQVLPWFPENSIHIVVVDPGVGSERGIIAARYDGRIVIAPDNGVISLVHRDMRIESIHLVQNSRFFVTPVSLTFHGRDILAPVAAHVACGLPLTQLGPVAEHIELLQLPAPRRLEPDGLSGEVMYIDHFGNLISNIDFELFNAIRRHTRDFNVHVGESSVGPVMRTYDEVPTGEPLALFGGGGLLEISVNRGRADEHFNAGTGTPITIK